jgi:hypothetical protein
LLMSQDASSTASFRMTQFELLLQFFIVRPGPRLLDKTHLPSDLVVFFQFDFFADYPA